MSSVTISMSTTSRLHCLRDYAETVSVSPTVAALVDRTLHVAAELLGASSASMSRYQRDRARVKIVHNVGDLTGWESAWPDDRYYPVGEYARLLTTLGTQEPMWTGSVDDPDTSPTDRDLLVQLGKRHAASFQIRVADRVWGDLFVTRSGGDTFDEDDCAAGSALAGLMSAGLSRLDVINDLSDLAYTDSLTGLANRRAAEDWLHQRLAADEPFPRVSVVLCDINGLKQVNDEYGHDAGDKLVRSAATALVTAIGEIGTVLVARVGGDEFLILLAGAAQHHVDLLVQRVSDLVLPHHGGLAVGAATTRTRPAGARNPQTAASALLRLADAAQYRHKQTRQLPAETTSVGLTSVPALVPAAANGISDRVLKAFRSSPGTSVEHRLQTVCEEVAQAYDAATWWVNRQQDGALIDVLGRVLRTDVRGALAGVDLISGEEFDPRAYPATEQALDGGSYFASLTDGDPGERALLARMGYVQVLAAGETDADGTGWLVEVFGDPKTSPALCAAECCLRALVHIAVTGAGGSPGAHPTRPQVHGGKDDPSPHQQGRRALRSRP